MAIEDEQEEGIRGIRCIQPPARHAVGRCRGLLGESIPSRSVLGKVFVLDNPEIRSTDSVAFL